MLSFSCVFPGRYYSILEFQKQDLVVQNAVDDPKRHFLVSWVVNRDETFNFRLSNDFLGLSWSLLQYSGVSEAGPGSSECC